MIEVNVKGAANLKEARQAARTIVSSNLLKAAIYGNDPNWGRVTAALGRSGAQVEESKLDVYVGKIQVLKQGIHVPLDKVKAISMLKQKEVPITVVLNMGAATPPPGAATSPNSMWKLTPNIQPNQDLYIFKIPLSDP